MFHLKLTFFKQDSLAQRKTKVYEFLFSSSLPINQVQRKIMDYINFSNNAPLHALERKSSCHPYIDM